MVSLLENYEESKHKYNEEIEILKLKCEKYEIFLDKKEDKIDTDTLDGRVTFLVNVLEEYRKRLEEDVRREREEGELEEETEGQENSLVDYENSGVYKKQNSF